MGKMIQWAQTKAYMIVIICLVAVGCLLMFLGGIFTATGTPVIHARQLEIVGSGAVLDEIRPNVWHIDAINRDTNFKVWTNHPWQATPNAPATLVVHRGQGIVDVTPSVMGNDWATITLLNDGQTGIPQFHRPDDDPDKVVINVTAGGQAAQIWVRVLPTTTNVQMETRLERRVGVPARWDPVLNNRVHVQDFIDTETIAEGSFRVMSRLVVFGETVMQSQSMTYRDSFIVHDFHPLITGSGISIFGPPRHEVPGNAFRSHLHIRDGAPNALRYGGIFSFEITVDFNGWSFSDSFSLTLDI